MLLFFTFGYFAFFHVGYGFVGGFLHFGISYDSILKGLPLISSQISIIEVYAYPRFLFNKASSKITTELICLPRG